MHEDVGGTPEEIAAINVRGDNLSVVMNDDTKEDEEGLEEFLLRKPFSMFHFAAQGYFAIYNEESKGQENPSLENPPLGSGGQKVSIVDSELERLLKIFKCDIEEPRCEQTDPKKPEQPSKNKKSLFFDCSLGQTVKLGKRKKM